MRYYYFHNLVLQSGWANICTNKIWIKSNKKHTKYTERKNGKSNMMFILRYIFNFITEAATEGVLRKVVLKGRKHCEFFSFRVFHEIHRNFVVFNFIKKETLAQVFSCEFCKISKNIFFTG